MTPTRECDLSREIESERLTTQSHQCAGVAARDPEEPPREHRYGISVFAAAISGTGAALPCIGKPINYILA
ncbi:unnamed protein product, partial [Iphiclides podalirius]